MNRKPSKGIIGYVVLLSTLLLIAILLNGGLSQTVNISAPAGFDAAEAARLVRNSTRQMLSRMRGGV